MQIETGISKFEKQNKNVMIINNCLFKTCSYVKYKKMKFEYQKNVKVVLDR